MKDFAVVGSGVGGSCIAAYLSAKGHSVALFEKESYLGGCSSSFSHGGYSYNTGATTLAGYEDGFVLKEMFDAIGFRPNLIQTDSSIVVMQNGKITPRYKDFQKFLEVVSTNYPHAKNDAFWNLVYEINRDFYALHGYTYSNATLLKKLLSLTTFLPFALKFSHYLWRDAHTFIDDFFGGIDAEYLQFLESQILIVAQAPTQKINFFTAAISLGYTFYANHYVVGGFSKLFDDLTKNIEEVHRKSEILKIIKKKSHFELHTKEAIFEAKKVILNTTVYESAALFDYPHAKNYYKKYEKLDNHQSSFMLYMSIKSEKNFQHHYQIIKDKIFPHAISQALFVSFSDVSDTQIAACGTYSITASLHTDSRFWEDKSTYKAQKKELQDILIQTVLETLEIQKEEVLVSFCATPKTFKRYINRSQLGGNAITMKNFLPFLPSNDTPIQGLYNVGDTVYAAQGWSGVMLGVKNLTKLLHV